jgi:hypothetical protein
LTYLHRAIVAGGGGGGFGYCEGSECTFIEYSGGHGGEESGVAVATSVPSAMHTWPRQGAYEYGVDGLGTHSGRFVDGGSCESGGL